MNCYTFMALIRGTHQSRNNSPTTVGSRSTNNALGTCFPPPVSLKNVLKESSPPPSVLSLGIWPSGWMPCSKQYNSQHTFPIWTPAWPTWIDIHSRYKSNFWFLNTLFGWDSEILRTKKHIVFSINPQLIEEPLSRIASN